ncbi:hypothetical protein TNCT_291 [Trichonephila clavata]|uniref:Uncharacterized protein n=1 Tax=Trichonephila clavata TaxID=2740835 RepID=A0A8X6KM79_TRICU|nr:hypothetical protein TNCT_291 [Trichonephila clavata]
MLSEASPEDDSLFKIVKTHNNENNTFPIPPIVGPIGLHYSTEDKVNLFADYLERAPSKKIRNHMMTSLSMLKKKKTSCTATPDATPHH